MGVLDRLVVWRLRRRLRERGYTEMVVNRVVGYYAGRRDKNAKRR